MSERDQVNNMLVETVDLSVLSANDGSGQVPVSGVARINGVALNRAAEGLGAEALRQRACTELLRQAAIREGLLAADDAVPVDGVTSEAASQAIDAWLTRELQLPEPSVEACQRHHAAHQARYRTGEKIQVRHILFAVTPGMDVVALRNRAEACLLDVRCHDGQAQASAGFGRSARELSNCPSAELGGDLGWLTPADCDMAPVYVATKFALVGFVRSLQPLAARFGVRVNAVAPVTVDTPMVAGMLPPDVRAFLGREEVPSACWADYASTVNNYMVEFASCIDSYWWIPGWTSACAFQFSLQSELAFFWLISCSGGMPI